MKTIISILLGCTIIYLLGSFYSVSFNLNEWSDFSRFLTTLGMLCVIIITVMKYSLNSLK